MNKVEGYVGRKEERGRESVWCAYVSLDKLRMIGGRVLSQRVSLITVSFIIGRMRLLIMRTITVGQGREQGTDLNV